MNNNLEFENEDPSPDSIEDNHPRTNYGEGYYVKETLEEAAEINSEKHHYALGQQSEFYQLGFIEGAKWQAERMYSEEEVLELILKSKIETSNLYYEDMKEWFEQIKKK